MRVRIFRNGLPVSYAQILSLWQEDETLRCFITQTLADLPMTAFRWETPPVRASTAGRAFEFVAYDCPALEREPDPDTFADHFTAEVSADVVDFPNLGQDAVLVVPRPVVQTSAYGHLASFLRQAPMAQVDALWILVGVLMQRRLDANPVWLNTAGLGVPWLHIRLDDCPKYYDHSPYMSTL